MDLDPRDAATQRLLTLIELLASSNSLLEVHDQIEVPVDDAAAFVTWAVRALIRATQAELVAGDRLPGRPAPDEEDAR